MPEIYVREKDKRDAKIRNLEQRCKALENDNLVLRQRVAVIEDRFRPSLQQSDIVLCAGTQPNDEGKKSRKPRKVAT